MTLQVGNANTVDIKPEDLQVAYRGVTAAVKCVQVNESFEILACIKKNDTWLVSSKLYSDTLSSLELAVKKRGDAVSWVKDGLLPKINEWLGALFPPNKVAEVSAVAIEIDRAVSGIRFIAHADGTLVATL